VVYPGPGLGAVVSEGSGTKCDRQCAERHTESRGFIDEGGVRWDVSDEQAAVDADPGSELLALEPRIDVPLLGPLRLRAAVQGSAELQVWVCVLRVRVMGVTWK
jgi:hypothetical protein